MPCRFDELKNACNAKGLTDVVPYIESVRFKIVMARYYAGLADECRQTANRIGDPITNGLPNAEWLVNLYRVEAHTLCAMQMMHSTADFIGQVLDKGVLAPKGKDFGEDNCYAWDVYKRLKKVPDTANLRNAFHSLLSAKEFMYVSAFVNTVKHRRLIDIHYNVTIGPSHCIDGVQFSGFKYRRKKTVYSYDKLHASVICSDYMDAIEHHVCSIVDELLAFIH